MFHIGQLTDGYQFWQKVEKKRNGFAVMYYERCETCGNRWRRILLTMVARDPALQNYVLLPEGFTEFVYHGGNGKELRSTVNHGLIPGGVSIKTGRQAVLFTVVNPMDNQDGLGENICDLSQARVASSKNTWKTLQNTVC